MSQAGASAAPQRTKNGSAVALGIAWLIGLGFVIGFALPYFSLNQEKFALYWPRRFWLLAHLGGGLVALLVGPFTLRLGLARKRMALHRGLGICYMVSIALSSVAALYLALHTDLGWVFGLGLTSLNLAWIVTTGLAYLAIKRRQILQHQEWMIRSYVVTFGFVNFRIFVGILQAAGVGTLNEQLIAASWFAWSVPLVITEAVLQGRKIFGSSPTAYRG